MNENTKRVAGWLLFVGICLFGLLSFVNQLMPFWFNVLFIVGCLVALWLLPKPRHSTSTQDSTEDKTKES
jgi:hypothetical protein